MASLINLSALTLNPQEALSASEAIFEKLYSKEALKQGHVVATGIKMQTQIPFYGKYGRVGKKSLGSCNVNAETAESVATQKYWTPQLIDFRLSHCQEDMDQLFKMWQRSPDALKTWEEIANEELAFLADLTVDATLESILRITSFGDTGALNIAGGGNITDGISVLYLTMIEGLWEQIFTGVAAGTIPRYTINENAGANYVAQDNLAADRALLAMRSLFNKIDVRARYSPGLVYQMTDSLYKNWLTMLEDKSLAFTLERTEKGKVTQMSYRGIPIVVRDDWDRNILEYLDTTAKLFLPHRMTLSPINNFPIGTSDESNFSEFDMFYDKTTKNHYTDVAYRIDVKLLEEYMTAAAY